MKNAQRRVAFFDSSAWATNITIREGTNDKKH